MLLHTFGWALVYEMEKDKVKRVYPARVEYRGFSEKDNTKGYMMISEYMRDNAESLADEASE